MEFRETLMHLMSLMHGLALQHLRGDWDLYNLRPYDPTEPLPPVVSFCLSLYCLSNTGESHIVSAGVLVTPKESSELTNFL